MLAKSVRLFTLLVVVNPFLIISFQNCSRPSSEWQASRDKQVTNVVVTTELKETK